MAAEEPPITPAATGRGSNLAGHGPVTPQQATPGATPITKAIALLQHRSSATPSSGPVRTARTAELSARKAELATLLNQVNISYVCCVQCQEDAAEPCCANRHSATSVLASATLAASCVSAQIAQYSLHHSNQLSTCTFCLAVVPSTNMPCVACSKAERPHNGDPEGSARGMASACACFCMQVKTMESGLYIPKSGTITPRSTQGYALKAPADVPVSALRDPSGKTLLQYHSAHLSQGQLHLDPLPPHALTTSNCRVEVRGLACCCYLTVHCRGPSA